MSEFQAVRRFEKGSDLVRGGRPCATLQGPRTMGGENLPSEDYGIAPKKREAQGAREGVPKPREARWTEKRPEETRPPPLSQFDLRAGRIFPDSREAERPTTTDVRSGGAEPIASEGEQSVDFLSNTEGAPDPRYVDQVPPAGPGGGGAAPAAPGAAPAVPAAAALPTELIQIVTTDSLGPTEYGFQLKFRCRSTSGDVKNLQARAPNLIWRERVTTSRNDFVARISPPNPTILPPGGVSFAAADTHVVGTNLLEFVGVRDTHHMPTAAVKSTDFVPAGALPLPGVLESRQTYQFSTDGGGAWRYFAGDFIIRRTLFRDGAGALRFRTQKVGIHEVTEPFKP